MSIEQNIKHIQTLMTAAQNECHRSQDTVLLLAVSKQQSVAAIKEAYQYGIRHFAENYWQEAQEKIKALASNDIIWHFIGPIQSNKAKYIARNFDWVHTINSLNIASLLNKYREGNEPLNVCLQINLTQEQSKSGITEEQAPELADAISALGNLRLKGLMAIPPPIQNNEQQYALFLRLKKCLNLLNTKLNLKLDTLSIGMSDDFIPAIAAGSTMIRIGTGIFGKRSTKDAHHED
jgi:pyridoxal phosphate enzyme (YggS family)